MSQQPNNHMFSHHRGATVMVNQSSQPAKQDQPQQQTPEDKTPPKLRSGIHYIR